MDQFPIFIETDRDSLKRIQILIERDEKIRKLAREKNRKKRGVENPRKCKGAKKIEIKVILAQDVMKDFLPLYLLKQNLLETSSICDIKQAKLLLEK